MYSIFFTGWRLLSVLDLEGWHQDQLHHSGPRGRDDQHGGGYSPQEVTDGPHGAPEALPARGPEHRDQRWCWLGWWLPDGRPQREGGHSRPWRQVASWRLNSTGVFLLCYVMMSFQLVCMSILSWFTHKADFSHSCQCYRRGSLIDWLTLRSNSYEFLWSVRLALMQ